MNPTFYLRAGETKRLPIVWTAGGEPVDTTGMAGTLAFFGQAGRLVAAFTGASVAMGPGRIDVFLSDEATAGLAAARSYRLKVHHPNGDVTYLLEGAVAFGRPGTGKDGVAVIERETVKVVSLGVQGPPGGAAAHIHDQAVASDTWTVTHNLGAWPDVTIFDRDGAEVDAAVHNLSLNHLTISFVVPFAGFARCV